MRGYKNRLAKCIIYIKAYKVEEHQCRVTSCTKSKGKVCFHIIVKYVNCGGSHITNSPYCISKQKVSIQASKKRKLKKQSKKKKEKVVSKNRNNVGKKDKSPQPKTKIDLKAEN